jgi:uncharacterized protein YjiS (DUF1127 family)
MSTHVACARPSSHRVAIAAMLRGLTGRAVKLWVALRNRREVNRLGDLDAAMLKDIGLTPSDVAAALDLPLNEDPSRHLTRVAAGRSLYRRS